MHTSAKGNALFLILIAVALFAALSYAVTQSGRGAGSVSKEQSRLVAQQFLDRSNMIRVGVQRMVMMHNIAIEDIDFGKTDTGPTALFAPEGGGVTWVDPPANAFTDGVTVPWEFVPAPTGAFWGVGTSVADPFIWVQGAGLKDEICKSINQLMGNPYAIPVDNNGGAVKEAYNGATAFCYKEGAQVPEFMYAMEVR